MTEPELIRVVVADRSPVARQQIRHVLERGPFAVIAETDRGDEAALLAAANLVGAVVLHERLDDVDGAEAIRLTRSRSPWSKIVLVSPEPAKYAGSLLIPGPDLYIDERTVLADLPFALRILCTSPSVAVPQRAAIGSLDDLASGFAVADAGAVAGAGNGQQAAARPRFPRPSQREFKARLHTRELTARAPGRREREAEEKAPSHTWYAVLTAGAAALVLVVGLSVLWTPLRSTLTQSSGSLRTPAPEVTIGGGAGAHAQPNETVHPPTTVGPVQPPNNGGGPSGGGSGGGGPGGSGAGTSSGGGSGVQVGTAPVSTTGSGVGGPAGGGSSTSPGGGGRPGGGSPSGAPGGSVPSGGSGGGTGSGLLGGSGGGTGGGLGLGTGGGSGGGTGGGTPHPPQTGNPHAPGETGNPHAPGKTGNPHDGSTGNPHDPRQSGNPHAAGESGNPHAPGSTGNPHD